MNLQIIKKYWIIFILNQEVNFTAQDLIRGIQPDSHSQQEARELALELMQYLR